MKSSIPVVLGALALTNCAGPEPGSAEWERRVMDVLQARKAGDTPRTDHRAGRVIGSVSAADYVKARTAFLIGGRNRVTIRGNDRNFTVNVTWKPDSEDSERNFSSAAAITDDGYFLTAAHCLESLPVRMIFSRADRLQLVAIRVVWRGEWAKGGPDLALIHAPVRGEPAFSLLGSDHKSPSRDVWVGGFGLFKQAQVPGRLLSIGPWREGPDGARWRELWHNAPLTSGDSGGPVVDLTGRLLGVNASGEGGMVRLFGRDYVLSYRAEVVSPDPKWIASLIARDRARRRR